jgi:hypothetical protein
MATIRVRGNFSHACVATHRSLVRSAPGRSAFSETLRRQNAMNPKCFFAEPKRRNLYKVAIAYALTAWLRNTLQER